MKRKYWLQLAGINLLVIISIILPFLPGPPNRLVIALSAFGQFTGLFGLVLVPVGILWTILEIKKKSGYNEDKHARYAFYLAVTTIIIFTTMCMILVIAITISSTALIGIPVFLLVAIGLIFAIRKIKKTKLLTRKFNPIPLFIFTLPLVAFITRTALVGPVSNYSRDVAINRSGHLIAAIETYKNKSGQYPNSIRELENYNNTKIPGPFIMGILEFRYHKINDHYSLSFSQWLECGSLEEIVLYDKNNLRYNLTGQFAKYDYTFDLCRIKGAFATRITPHKNWQYYLID